MHWRPFPTQRVRLGGDAPFHGPALPGSGDGRDAHAVTDEDDDIFGLVVIQLVVQGRLKLPFRLPIPKHIV